MIKRIALCVLGVAWSITASAEPKDDARRHFISGLEAAQAEQYTQALTHFLNAQRAYPHPNTLYNIARAYQDLDDLPNAIRYYELFQQANQKRLRMSLLFSMYSAPVSQRPPPHCLKLRSQTPP